MFRELLDNKVPSLWKAKSYLSIKSLGRYFSDLAERVSFFKSWIENGTPSEFRLNSFFFAQSLLTAVLLNYSRNE